MVRSHQLCSEGFQVGMNGRLVTIWSAPNYCYRFKNKAAVGVSELGQALRIVGFEAAEENVVLQNIMQVKVNNFDEFFT